MIEKEVFFEDKENNKGSMFYIKANNITDFFKTAEDIANELNRRTKSNLEIKYDILVFDLKELDDVQHIRNSTINNHSMVQ